MAKEFRRTLTRKDFAGTVFDDANGTITLVANIWTKLGVYTVPKGVRTAVGQRFDAHYYAYFMTTTSNAICHARVRVVVSDPTEYNRRVVAEFDTTQVTKGTADKKLMPYAPLEEIWVKGDSKIILEAMPTTAVVALGVGTTSPYSLVRIPVTFKKD